MTDCKNCEVCECGAVDPIAAFDAFLNEPPDYENLRMVREYRHAAYAKWKSVMVAIDRQAARIAELESKETGLQVAIQNLQATNVKLEAERVDLVRASLEAAANEVENTGGGLRGAMVAHALRAIDPATIKVMK